MSIGGRLKRLESAASGAERPGAERVTVDGGEGYRVDVDALAGTLAKIAQAYGGGDELRSAVEAD